MTGTRPRVLWVAGTRSDVLRLGPYALHFQSVDEPRERIHWFAVTGEQGMAAYQALDDCGLRPDAEAELRHPAEDPAVRLQGLIGEVETLARRYRATHVVFAGCGPTAAASALVCHGRGLRGVWLKPHDPAGLIGRLRWERGLKNVVESLGETVGALETRPGEGSGGEAALSGTSEEPAGRRADRPLAMVAITRPAWGASDLPERVVTGLAAAARSRPDVDWLMLRSLDARFEGPLHSLAARPANLLTAPPVPYATYAAWLAQSALMITDSWAIAAECRANRVEVVALGETGGHGAAPSGVVELAADDVDGEAPLGGEPSIGSGSTPGRIGTSLWAFNAHLRNSIGAALR